MDIVMDGISAERPDLALRQAPVRRGALYALALGAFAVGTEGFMIAAILPDIAGSLAVSVQAAGQLVTVFALVYALSSPLLTALTASVPRRRLLMLSLAGFMACNFVAALAPGYWALAAARVLLALTAGLYVPNANALAGALVPPAYRGRALAIVAGGITVAVALGVPLGAAVGAYLGWRFTFVGVAGLSAAALAVLGASLPRGVAPSPPVGLRARLAVIARPGAFPALLTTSLWALGAYEVYTYIVPFLGAAAGLGADQAGYLLTLLGLGAIGGVTVGGRATDRFGARRVQAVSLPVLALAFAGMTVAALLLAPHALIAIVPLVIVWGLSAWAFFPPQQTRLMAIAGAADTPVILSLNASFMYLGFSLGAAAGALVISLASVVWIGAVGAVCIVATTTVSHFAWRRAA